MKKWSILGILTFCLLIIAGCGRGSGSHEKMEQVFPWEDVDSCMDNSIEPKIEGICCPECGKEVKWIHFRSPKWTWEHMCGRAGALAICPDCRIQVEFICEGFN
jgi:hypothetical protein